MSLINDALKRADLAGKCDPGGSGDGPSHAPGRNILCLYDETLDEADHHRPTLEKKIHHLFGRNQTSIRGVVILGVCMIAVVAVMMHLSGPPKGAGPARAGAGNFAAGLVQADKIPLAEDADSGGENVSPEIDAAGPVELHSLWSVEGLLANCPESPAAHTLSEEKEPHPTVAVIPNPDAARIQQIMLPDWHTLTKPIPPTPKPEPFKLGGILASDVGNYAIINKQMVSVGDEIDGARVITIDKYHVVLEKDGKRMVLRM